MLWLYVGFVAFILALLALDLGVFHKEDKLDSVKAALGWSALWISLGVAFSGLIYLGYEHHCSAWAPGSTPWRRPTSAPTG